MFMHSTKSPAHRSRGSCATVHLAFMHADLAMSASALLFARYRTFRGERCRAEIKTEPLAPQRNRTIFGQVHVLA
jgi:hypothetical protein